MVDKPKLERACILILEAIGEEPNRAGLKETPRRFAGFWKEFIDYKDDNQLTIFEAVTADQMVVVSGMRVWSLCEHHLLPFYVDISIGYIARESILGLSKFARIAHHHAHKLQVQEKLVQDIANTLRDKVGFQDVAVIGTGEHLCMTMRGIQTPARMTSSILYGQFKTNPDTRREFLGIVQAQQQAHK